MDNITTEIESKQITTLEQLCQAAEINLKEWQVDTLVANSWDVTMKDSNHEPVRCTNWQVKAKLIKKLDIEDIDKFKQELINELKLFSPEVDLISHEYANIDNVHEINIPDVHLGKIGWSEETGQPDNDLWIALDRFRKHIDYHLKYSQIQKPGKILFVIGNDFFNSDHSYPFTSTTHGTPQHDSHRWQLIFREGRKVIIESIEKMKLIAPVVVKVIPGNHDYHKSFFLGEVLDVRYDKDKNVEIDNEPTTRKYFHWGNCFLMFTHGNRKDETLDRLMHKMQNYMIEHSISAKYKEIHSGDIHHHKALIKRDEEDIDGIVIKHIRPLLVADEWESKKGFEAQRGSHSFVWNKQGGLVFEIHNNL